MIDFIIECTLFLIAAILVLFLIVGVPYILYDEYKSEKFYLRKDQWECTKSHEEIITGGFMSNGVWIPTTSVNTVCDEYRRIK